MATKKRKSRVGKATVSAVVRALDALAPPTLAQDWDNVGLIAGDLSTSVRKILLCIDLSPEVATEAVRLRAEMVMAYHPPIFKPVSRLVSPGSDGGPEMGGVVYGCIRRGVAIYSMHTALDAAEGGTNDVLAGLCGVTATEPIEQGVACGPDRSKLVVFVPQEDLEKVARAMFAAGAGRIGQYSRCSYRTHGQGSFLGGAQTRPSLGKKGTFELVEEVRLETVVNADDLARVVAAMRDAHPYDEVAFDIYPLSREPVRGIGRIGNLAKPVALSSLARKLKRATGASSVQLVGPKDRKIRRVVVVAGAAGSLPFRASLTTSDAIVTGEIRHHDALSILRRDVGAIALGHFSSERPVLASLRRRIEAILPGVVVVESERDREPFLPL